MKTWAWGLLPFLFTLFVLSAQAQRQVRRAEYFIDVDPGFGQGSAVSVSTAADATVDANIRLAGVSNGFHKLGFRVQDDSLAWSHTHLRTIEVVRLAVADSIVGAEYFLDGNPAFGEGIPLPISPDTAGVVIPLNIALAGRPSGTYLLHLRVKDNRGIWSQTLTYPYEVVRTANPRIVAAEYFLNRDPGFGRGTLIAIVPNAGDSAALAINLSTVPFGQHTLYIRTLDDAGRWSHTISRIIENNRNVQPKVVSFEYSFQGVGADSNFVRGPFFLTGFTPSPEVDVQALIPPAVMQQIPADKFYRLSLWAVDDRGSRSLRYLDTIKNCSQRPVHADFEVIAIGTRVTIVNNTTNASKYHWDFGDGVVDSVSNPVHEYAAGGNYRIHLSAENFCNVDTASYLSSVSRLSGVSPDKIGNSGVATIQISGSNLKKLNKFFLIHNQDSHALKFLSYGSDSSVTGFVQLRNVATQVYSVVGIDTLSGYSVSLVNAVSVEALTKKQTEISLAAPAGIRVGRVENISVTLYNPGNIDNLMIPFTLYYPSTLSIAVRDSLVRLIGIDSLPQVPDTAGVFFTRNDTTFLSLIAFNVPASGQVTYEFSLSASAQGAAFIGAYVGIPLLDSISLQNARGENFSLGCYSAMFGLGLATVGIIPTLGCATSIALTTADFANTIFGAFQLEPGNERVSTILLATASFGNLFAGITLAGVACGAATLSLPVQLIISGVGLGISAASLVNDPECLDAIGKKLYNVISVASRDPNEKVGPRGFTPDNYHQGRSPFPYTIYFENVATATAPAQAVYITDTLDKRMLDLSTFRLGSFAFGDSSKATAPQGLTEYATTIDLRPGKNMLVRIDARLDTATGVVRWRFLSLDPATRDSAGVDVFDGFLPPNTSGRRGEGYVSYSIQPKPGLATGAQIRNRASIVFDANPPIITNTFLNTIDKTLPTSRVTALAPATSDTAFTVRWTGADAHSSRRSWDVYVSVNNRPFRRWQYDTYRDSATFYGRMDSSYAFFSIAKDHAGNIETMKTAAEASTRITATAPSMKKELVFKAVPNPFGGSTTLEFSLPSADAITITVADLNGRAIATLASDRQYMPGLHKLKFDTRRLPNGTYVCTVRSGRYSGTQKLVKID